MNESDRMKKAENETAFKMKIKRPTTRDVIPAESEPAQKPSTKATPILNNAQTIFADLEQQEEKKKKESKPKAPSEKKDNKPKATSRSSEKKNFTFRLYNEEDLLFFSMYPLRKQKSKQQFFEDVFTKAVSEDKSKIDFSDETLRQFLSGGSARLATKPISVAVSISLLEKISGAAAYRMMPLQKYVAYVIHKERLANKDWEGIIYKR